MNPQRLSAHCLVVGFFFFPLATDTEITGVLSWRPGLCADCQPASLLSPSRLLAFLRQQRSFVCVS